MYFLSVTREKIPSQLVSVNVGLSVVAFAVLHGSHWSFSVLKSVKYYLAQVLQGNSTPNLVFAKTQVKPSRQIL